MTNGRTVVAIGGLCLAAVTVRSQGPAPAAAPASTVPMRWYKGNTHTHTINQGGDSTPDEVVRWYREHGYQFVVITDHNLLTKVDGLNAIYRMDEQFLVVQGELSVLAEGTDGQLHRLSTLSAGMGFGEPSLAGGGTRTASVRADTRAVSWVLDRAAYESLDGPEQSIRVKLLENLLRSSTRSVARLTGEALAAEA